MISHQYTHLDLGLIYSLLEFQDRFPDSEPVGFKKQRKNDGQELIIENSLYSKINEMYHQKDDGEIKEDSTKYKSFNEILNESVTIKSSFDLSQVLALQNMAGFNGVKSHNHIITFTIYGCKFNFHNDKFNIRNGKIKGKPTLVIGFDFDSKMSSEVIQLADDISLCNISQAKCENTVQVSNPILTMDFDLSTNTLSTTIKYKANYGCSVNQVIPPNIMMKINRILYRGITRDQELSGTQESAITPQLFYDSMQNTATNLPQPPPFEIPELETNLLKFQTKTVNWLLNKEGVKYNPATSRVEAEPLVSPKLVETLNQLASDSSIDKEIEPDAIKQIHKILNSLCFGWERIFFNGKRFWYNRYNANLVDEMAIYKFIINYCNSDTNNLPGTGLLSEEMGLGKTVEVVSLVLLNQRNSNEIDQLIKVQLRQYGDLKSIIKSKTTLIIAPDSILKQWVEEVIKLAPSLAVTIYRGLDTYPKLNNNARLISNYLKMFDIVFTTYSVIGRELDYALYSSKNNLTRSSKKRTEKFQERYSTGLEVDQRDAINYGPGEEEKKKRPNPMQEYLDMTDAERAVVIAQGGVKVYPIPRKKDIKEKPISKKELADYQAYFQVSMRVKKPKNANEKTNEKQDGTDYERALQDEINLALKHNETNSTDADRTYQSPLMLLQFWRVVLDEVQMVSSKISRSFQSASLIPRYHSWGVSGTPIKKNLSDLHSVLSFLKVSPFIGEIGKNSWEIITRDSIDFCKVWSMIGIRHTKAMVHDDIKLPPQHRMLLTIPFNPVEQENYNSLLAECLSAICLDSNGRPVVDDWEPTMSIIMIMKQWLVKLRQVCGNPQVGKLNLSTRRYKSRNYYFTSIRDRNGWYGNGPRIQTIQTLKTLDDVLDDMLTNASNDIINVERKVISEYLEYAQLLEIILYPEVALSVFDEVSVMVQKVIGRITYMLNEALEKYEVLKNEDTADEKEVDLQDIDEQIKGYRGRLRLWNILLHKCYFLLGSSYFQLYDEEYRRKITKLRKSVDVSSKGFSKNFNQNLIDELLISKPLNIDIVSSKQLLEKYQSSQVGEGSNQGSGEESEQHQHIFMEQSYYDLSEKLRLDILSASIKTVESAIKSRFESRDPFHNEKFYDDGSLLLPKTTKKLFKSLPLIKISESELIGIKIKFFYEKVVQLITQLNSQGQLINSWMNRLIEILSSPLLSHDKDPNGEEYERSIVDQDKASSYFHVLNRMIIDRMESINGKDNSTKIVIAKKQEEENEFKATLATINDHEFIELLEDERKSAKPKSKTSLNDLIHEIKNIENDLKYENAFLVEVESFKKLSEKLSNIFDNQKLSTVLFQKELTVNCNFVFNARIEYFKQLQQISDSVKMPDFGLETEDLDVDKIKRLFTKFDRTVEQLIGKLDRGVSKFRYLSSLSREPVSAIKEIEVQKEPGKYENFDCVICRSTITIGSLTHCGHKYCKDCLEQWLRSHGNCPMCKTPINFSTIHNFTHYEPNLKAKKIETSTKNTNLYSIYKHMDSTLITDIQNIQLKESYSSKVDMIVKQVLYLKSKDPKVQIVIFSQWQDLLYILATAFKNSEISYLASYGTLTPEVGGGRRKSKYDSVEDFKDPKKRITCFLLNARAQASGLTLINASHIFLCEPLVNTSLELQAISRIHRIGQTKVTTVWMFAIENTVEESIVLLSTNKRLQYMEQQEFRPNDLMKIESMTLTKSGGIDTLVQKGAGEGETVSNGDLWDAFFCSNSSDLRETMNIDTLSKV